MSTHLSSFISQNQEIPGEVIRVAPFFNQPQDISGQEISLKFIEIQLQDGIFLKKWIDYSPPNDGLMAVNNG